MKCQSCKNKINDPKLDFAKAAILEDNEYNRFIFKCLKCGAKYIVRLSVGIVASKPEIVTSDSKESFEHEIL